MHKTILDTCDIAIVPDKERVMKVYFRIIKECPPQSDIEEKMLSIERVEYRGRKVHLTSENLQEFMNQNFLK